MSLGSAAPITKEATCGPLPFFPEQENQSAICGLVFLWEMVRGASDFYY